MGNATKLYTDANVTFSFYQVLVCVSVVVLHTDPNVSNVTFSFYQGPKRIAPLFSLSARDSFVAFCQRRGTLVTTLPADRAEFNDDDSTVRLPR
jgi:hypothetical protein